MVEPLSARVAMLGAGACSCGVKTPLVHFHEPTCLYRRISDIADAVEVLEDSETELEARAEKAEAELSAVSAAIGVVEFMDPPDGGGVPLSEQVRRLSAELARLRAAGTFK